MSVTRSSTTLINHACPPSKAFVEGCFHGLVVCWVSGWYLVGASVGGISLFAPLLWRVEGAQQGAVAFTMFKLQLWQLGTFTKAPFFQHIMVVKSVQFFFLCSWFINIPVTRPSNWLDQLNPCKMVLWVSSRCTVPMLRKKYFSSLEFVELVASSLPESLPPPTKHLSLLDLQIHPMFPLSWSFVFSVLSLGHLNDHHKLGHLDPHSASVPWRSTQGNQVDS